MTDRSTGIGRLRWQTARIWRVAMAAASFGVFGLGGLALGFIAFPWLGLLSEEGRAQRRCRYAIHLGFRAFVAWMAFVGLLRCEVKGASRLRSVKGALVVANHPSLIDVIVLVSHLPDAYCVVKEGVWRNPFYGRVVRAAGYIPSIQADHVVERAAALIRAGEVVVLFPEGTRTSPGERPSVRRGAALVLLRSGRPALPVRLELRPGALTKGYNLLGLPGERLHLAVTVGEEFGPESFATGTSERADARAGAQLLQDILRNDQPPLMI